MHFVVPPIRSRDSYDAPNLLGVGMKHLLIIIINQQLFLQMSVDAFCNYFSIVNIVIKSSIN